MRLFMNPYRWLVFSKSTKNFIIPQNLNLLPDSRFWSMEACDKGRLCVKSWYKYSKIDGAYLETIVGIWKMDKGFSFYEEQIFPSRERVDLNQIPIKISLVVTNNDTLNHLWDYRSKSLARSSISL